MQPALKALNPLEMPLAYGPVIVVSPVGTGAYATAWIVLYRAVGERGLEVGVLKRSTDPDQRRFRRRAELALKLDHPNIATTLATLEIQGEMHILEEYVHGGDVKEIAKSDFSSAAAVYIAHELARALEALDERGYVHRDIAAENVRISCEGDVKLLDLGFATAPEYRDSKLTAPGFAYAREAYAAPELRQGATANGQSDLYAVGVILWDLLAKKKRHHERPLHTRPSEVNPEVPAELDAIVLKAVHPSPAERYATAAELRAELGAWLQGQGVAGRKALVDSLSRFRFMSKLAFDSLEQSIEQARAFAERHPPPAVNVRAIKAVKGDEPIADPEAFSEFTTAVVGRMRQRAWTPWALVAAGLMFACGAAWILAAPPDAAVPKDAVKVQTPTRPPSTALAPAEPESEKADVVANAAPAPAELRSEGRAEPLGVKVTRKGEGNPRTRTAVGGPNTAAEFAELAANQIAANHRAEALRTLEKGLQKWPYDQRLAMLRDGLLR